MSIKQALTLVVHNDLREKSVDPHFSCILSSGNAHDQVFSEVSIFTSWFWCLICDRVWYLRKLEVDVMKNWDLNFFLYFSVLYQRSTNSQWVVWGSKSQVLVKHLEYVKCNLKAETLAGLDPSTTPELSLQHPLMLVLQHLHSDRAFWGRKQPYNAISPFPMNLSLHALLLDAPFLDLTTWSWSLLTTGSLVLLRFTYRNRTTARKINTNTFVCIKTL